MSGLTEQDREELACRCHVAACPLHNDLALGLIEHEVAELTAAVEQIVARHVVAALNEAADEIRHGVLPSHPNSGYVDGFRRCEQIVRSRAT